MDIAKLKPKLDGSGITAEVQIAQDPRSRKWFTVVSPYVTPARFEELMSQVTTQTFRNGRTVQDVDEKKYATLAPSVFIADWFGCTVDAIRTLILLEDYGELEAEADAHDGVIPYSPELAQFLWREVAPARFATPIIAAQQDMLQQHVRMREARGRD